MLASYLSCPASVLTEFIVSAGIYFVGGGAVNGTRLQVELRKQSGRIAGRILQEKNGDGQVPPAKSALALIEKKRESLRSRIIMFAHRYEPKKPHSLWSAISHST